jgi:ATP-dependent DNA helicase RecG
MITKPQLIHILSTTESAHVERTTSTDNMDKFCQAICAFSNDVSGSGKNGYLIIGAHDNGGLSGLKVDDQLLLKISNIRTDGNILPQPVMNVEKFIFDDGDVLVAEVQPSEFPPVRYRGRIWVRVGPRKSVATEAEEKILTERRLSNIHTFDAMPCLGTTTNDLDVKLIEKEYLPKAVAEDVLTEDKRGIEEQLASLGFYDLRYNCPTNGAIVLFGRNPERYLHGSYIQYVRFKGKDRAGDIINEHKFAGNLCRVLPKIDTFIETSIAQKRPIPVSVLREETFSKYPYWATRELLMNAIMHRDYETNAPVQFYEYDDRIEIQNPGGLYGKVTPDNFPNVSDYRNPFIAEAMKVLGYVNRFSRGVYRVQKELMENGNGKAVFDFSLVTAFKVIENISEKYLEEGFGAETTQEKPKKSPRKAQEKPKKSPRKIEEEIVMIMESNPQVTRKELAKKLDRTEDSIRYYLRKLTKAGIIEHEGPTKSGKWVIPCSRANDTRSGIVLVTSTFLNSMGL